MIKINRPLTACITAAAILVSSAASPAPARLTPDQMRALAGQAISKGFTPEAYDISSALLRRDPDDLQALLLHSRSARDLGKLAEAKTSARRAWFLSSEPPEKFSASMAMAQALSSDGKRSRAQLWLRRAAQNAPDDRTKAIAERDFGYVRARNKWSTSLSFNLSPTSNINNGSRKETTTITNFGFPIEVFLVGKSRALSGTEISLGFDTRYKLAQTERSSTNLSFGLNHTNYVLSDEAKKIAPDAKGSDYAQTVATIGLSHDLRLPSGRSGLGFDGTLGRVWLGGDPFYDFVRLGAAWRYALDKKTGTQLRISHEAQTGNVGRTDAQITTFSAGISRQLESGARLSLSAQHALSTSDAHYLDYTSTSVGARFHMAKPVLGAGLEFGLSARRKEHDEAGNFPDGRLEDTVSADITAVIDQVEFYGFVPTISLHASRTEALSSLYDKEELGLRMGIRSSF